MIRPIIIILLIILPFLMILAHKNYIKKNKKETSSFNLIYVSLIVIYVFFVLKLADVFWVNFVISKKFKNFSEFFPYYLSEHNNKFSKLFNFIGFSLFAYFQIKFMTSLELKNIAFGFISAYVLAWFSHFIIEKNKPAKFFNPIYSFWRLRYVLWNLER